MRYALLLPALLAVAACTVTVAPAATPAAKPTASPGAASKPSPGGKPAPEDDRLIVAGSYDKLEPPVGARVGEKVAIKANVALSSGCIGFVDAEAIPDQAARRVVLRARIKTAPDGVACGMVYRSHPVADLAFTPQTAGAWTIVANEGGRKPIEVTFEVGEAGASPAPTASPTAGPSPDGSPIPADWLQEALSFSALRPPAQARAGQPAAVGYTATIGSSSCARFEAATAEVDAAARIVKLAGTRRVAPPGTACTKDLRSQDGEVQVTLPAAGSWTVTAPGAPDATFDVAP